MSQIQFQIDRYDNSFELNMPEQVLAFELIANDNNVKETPSTFSNEPVYSLQMRGEYVGHQLRALAERQLPAEGEFTLAANAVNEVAGNDNSTVADAQQLLKNLGYWVTNVDGVNGPETEQAIIAFQKVQRRERTGTLSAADFELLRNARRPEAKFSRLNQPHVEVDLTRQVLFYVNKDGKVERTLSVSTGARGTPVGNFKVGWQVEGERHARLGTLYYPSYFNQGIAIHGSNSVPTYPASHGCVRIPRFAEREMFNMVKIGMPVIVYR